MTSYTPLVSIIINTHNSIEYLNAAIDSALQQTYPHVELIVYDNASVKDVKRITDQYKNKLTYYRSDNFLTLGEARNNALKLAKGDLIDFLDADDLFLPNKLEKQVPLFEDPTIGLVFSNSEHFQEMDGNIFSTMSNNTPPPDGKIFGNLLKKYYISWDSAIFRKSVIGNDPVQWFNEQFNICTDYDLFLRVSYFHKIVYVDEILSKWRSHEHNWSKAYSLSEAVERMMMIPRILRYEPMLFEKYSKQLHIYLANIYSAQSNYFWQKSFKKEAVLCTVHVFCYVPRLSTLIKIIVIPFCSHRTFERLRRLDIKTLWSCYKG